MTNTSNMSSGWEVAGAKKAKIQPNSKQVGAGPGAKAKTSAKETVAKFPKQETLRNLLHILFFSFRVVVVFIF